MAERDSFTRARLERIAERALRDAGVAGVLPTPLEEVQRAAGIGARHDIAALPEQVATPGRELLGALWFERREVYVDLAQPEPRRRFTDAHEAMQRCARGTRRCCARTPRRSCSATRRSRSRPRPTSAPGC